MTKIERSDQPGTPPQLGPRSSTDNVLEALFTRGDATLQFTMPYNRLFKPKEGKRSLASQILQTVIETDPLPADDPNARKANAHKTGGAHPSLSFTWLPPHDFNEIQVTVSNKPEDHQTATKEARGLLSPPSQPQIHITPDPSARVEPPHETYI